MRKNVLGKILIALALTVCVFCGVMLTGCEDDKESKSDDKVVYIYSDIRLEADGMSEEERLTYHEDLEEELGYVKKMYEGSTLEVNSENIRLTAAGITQEFSYTKDGNEYVLAAEFFEQAEETIGEAVPFSYVGREIENGFEFIIKNALSGQGIRDGIPFSYSASVILIFTKA